MDDRGEMTDPTHRILKDAIRYGIGAWVLFLGGLERDVLDGNGDDLWRLAAGLSGSYSILVLLLVGATIVAGW